MITDYTLMASLVNVERWGTTPRLRRTTVASHSFEVCWTIDWVIETVLEDGAVPSSEWRRLMRSAMRHDQTEGLTGDVPSPPKRLGLVNEDMGPFYKAYPRVGKSDPASSHSKLLLKMADRLCMLRDAQAEEQMGNRIYSEIIPRCYHLAADATRRAMQCHPVRAEFGTPPEVIAAYLAECPPLVGIALIVERDMEP